MAHFFYLIFCLKNHCKTVPSVPIYLQPMVDKRSGHVKSHNWSASNELQICDSAAAAAADGHC